MPRKGLYQNRRYRGLKRGSADGILPVPAGAVFIDINGLKKLSASRPSIGSIGATWSDREAELPELMSKAERMMRISKEKDLQPIRNSQRV